jgi:hypothetical protein
MYAPIFESARRVRIHNLGLYHLAVLLTDIKHALRVKYAHLLVVVDVRKGIPVAVISSEKQPDLGRPGNLPKKADHGSHFLCAFIGEMHFNYGASDDWADIDKFEKAALKLVERLGLTKQGATEQATNPTRDKRSRATRRKR